MSRSSDFTRRRAGGPESYEAGDRPESIPDRQFDDMMTEEMIGYGGDGARDWEKVGVFSAGLAIGAALGAAAAMLFTPRTGEDTRELLGSQARQLGGRAADGWDDLRDELRWLARRGRTSMRRGVTRGRWKAEDVVERGRRRLW
jgi:hypothetical protein